MPKLISKLPKGKPVKGKLPKELAHYQITHDWTHMLSPIHRRNGYKLHALKDDFEVHGIILTHKEKEVGHVLINEFPQYVSLHSDLVDKHRGKGLGFRMYEAAFAHTLHHLKKKVVKNIAGHSEDAHRIHTKLAQKYGLNYSAQEDKQFYRDGRPHKWYGPYQYTLKTEEK